MKIEAITLREIRMPLVHFFETSFGRIYDRRILLITAHCDGANGWGECVADGAPFYSSEWIDSAWLTIRDWLAPAVLGKVIDHQHSYSAVLATLGLMVVPGAAAWIFWPVPPYLGPRSAPQQGEAARTAT